MTRDKQYECDFEQFWIDQDDYLRLKCFAKVSSAKLNFQLYRFIVCFFLLLLFASLTSVRRVHIKFCGASIHKEEDPLGVERR